MSKRAKITLSGTGTPVTDEHGKYTEHGGKHSLMFTDGECSYFITASENELTVKKRGNLEYSMTFDKKFATSIDIITDYGTLSDIILTTHKLNLRLSDNTLEISAHYTLSSDAHPKTICVNCTILD